MSSFHLSALSEIKIREYIIPKCRHISSLKQWFTKESVLQDVAYPKSMASLPKGGEKNDTNTKMKVRFIFKQLINQLR